MNMVAVMLLSIALLSLGFKAGELYSTQERMSHASFNALIHETAIIMDLPPIKRKHK